MEGMRYLTSTSKTARQTFARNYSAIYGFKAKWSFKESLIRNQKRCSTAYRRTKSIYGKEIRNSLKSAMK